MTKVSEQALRECRTAIVLGSPTMPINEDALDGLVETVRPSFERVLDGDGGAEIWRRDRLKMLFNSGSIGALSALIARLGDLSATEVDETSLRCAFRFVKAGCDVRFNTNTDLKIFTKYCEGVVVRGQEPATAFWEDCLKAAR